MRDEADIEAFANAQSARLSPERVAFELAMFRSCVPQLYWHVKSSDVKHNQVAFQSKVMPYRRRLRRAHRHGYGLLFVGDNGTGKTLFISYLLARCAKAGYSTYYTTLKGMDLNIKRGYDDPASGRRLRAALAADFLAIDELGKEHARSPHLVAELEHVLKSRYDDGYPTLLASNLSLKTLAELYGPTVASMLDGRFAQVQLEGGDYRTKMAGTMEREMGYK